MDLPGNFWISQIFNEIYSINNRTPVNGTALGAFNQFLFGRVGTQEIRNRANSEIVSAGRAAVNYPSRMPIDHNN